ncbi:GNAT family N-acetyltransferase [filamentous cyanobacterium CCP1]|nr:GNAT family N-acetyltransferase [filamentous cyanobacterium CCP2]PSB60194.1 GNAT family N-acetyltransferase [filamentous cyanobacterium CCP1]
MHEVEIRDACLDDSPALACLISQLGYPTSSNEMKERLSAILIDPNYKTFVAEYQKEVIGIIGVGVGRYYEKNGIYGRLLALVVDEKWRSQGVGASLVAKAECWLKERKATSIVVNSGKQRGAAHRFYERLGYEETGLRLVKLLV